jgi:single-stranded-DNA-specific exonuclease
MLKGSGRSIPGFHLRDALDLASKRHPQLLRKFGGHAMAAGATLAEEDFDLFEQAFDAVAREWLDAATLTRTLATDGPLDAQWFAPPVVQALEAAVWGPSFDPPLFCDTVDVVSQRLVGERHLKLTLRHHGQLREGIWFGRSEPLPGRARVAYRLSLDEFNGQQRLQMVIEGVADS